MDAVIAIGAIALIWFAFRKVGLWRWVWLSIGVVVAAWEGISVLTTHMTISQQFGQYAAVHPVRGAFLVGFIIFSGIGLGIHLWVMRKKYQPKK